MVVVTAVVAVLNVVVVVVVVVVVENEQWHQIETCGSVASVCLTVSFFFLRFCDSSLCFS